MITEFCKILKLEESEVLGRSRINDIAIARHLYFWLLHKSGYSYTEIGRLNSRNHATIIHSIQVVNNAIEVNDVRITKVLEKVKHLRANNINGKRMYCPNCEGTGQTLAFEDYLGYNPIHENCEVCKGKGIIKASKIIRCKKNIILILK